MKRLLAGPTGLRWHFSKLTRGRRTSTPSRLGVLASMAALIAGLRGALCGTTPPRFTPSAHLF